MDVLQIIYFCFLFLSLVLSIVCKKTEKGLVVFKFLFGFSILTEIASRLLAYYNIDRFFVYHIFVPLEYSLWVYYFYTVIDKSIIKKIILYSVFAFIVFSAVGTFTFVGIKKFPSFQLNIEGLFLIIIATYALFNINVSEHISITARPVFWISVSVILYYSLIFTFMGGYNLIFHSKPVLEVYFLYVPNYILYTGLSLAFICQRWRTK